MTSFARTVSRVSRLVDSLLAQTLAAEDWPVVEARLSELVAALELRDRDKADAVCALLEQRFCSTPFILRTFETATSWFARVTAPARTQELAARAKAADFSGQLS